MTAQEYLSETEAMSHAGRCEVCFHELVDPVPPSIGEPLYLHAAFFSIECRLWWLCEEHAAEGREHWQASVCQRCWVDRPVSN